jgi:cell pole-organizing protein PopZ
MRQAGEPSVEEILESIKKVIARDNRAAAEPRPEPEDSVVAEASDEDDEDVLDLGAAGEFVATEASAEAAPEPLVAQDAVSSISDSLAALAMLSTPPASPQIVRSGETSLEGLARELLRPALAEWLDKNLPAMVERMVAAEIARIVSKKG